MPNVSVKVQVRAITDKSYLFKEDDMFGKEFWISKTQIEKFTVDSIAKNKGIVIIPEWIAKREGIKYES